MGASTESVFLAAEDCSLSCSLIGIKLINSRKDWGEGLFLSIESTLDFLVLWMTLFSFLQRGVTGFEGVDGTFHVLR